MRDAALLFIALAQMTQCTDVQGQRRAAEEQTIAIKRQADALERIANKQCTPLP